MATDEVSGIVAPVAVRTLRASGVEPMMVLLGDRPASAFYEEFGKRPEMLDKGLQADAEKLFAVFYKTLPGGTLHRLLRELMRSWKKGDLTLSRETWALSDVDDVIRILDSELGA